LHGDSGIENDGFKTTGRIDELVFDEAILKEKERTFFISCFEFSISHVFPYLRVSVLKLDYLLIFLSSLDKEMGPAIEG
jgi:hypothetical protein